PGGGIGAPVFAGGNGPRSPPVPLRLGERSVPADGVMRGQQGGSREGWGPRGVSPDKAPTPSRSTQNGGCVSLRDQGLGMRACGEQRPRSRPFRERGQVRTALKRKLPAKKRVAGPTLASKILALPG